MRPILWGDGTRWDDPNARWGFMLEPGDDGYVIPPPAPEDLSESKPKRKSKSMSSNETPENNKLLLALARNIKSGQSANEVSVGLHHHLAAAMDLLIKKVAGDPAAAPGSAARKGSQVVYRECVDLTGDAKRAWATLSDTTVKEFLTGYRSVLERVHGGAANAGWVAAGFPPGTTAVPGNHEVRQVLLAAAAAYLSGHADYETELPKPDGTKLNISSATATTLEVTMQTARTLINTRQGEQELCKIARDADVETLRKEVSGTIAELRGLLTAEDPRWELFGLNIPANPTPPLPIPSLTLTPLGSGKVLAEWPYTTRMEMTRLFLLRVGTDTEFSNVADPKDLAFTIKDLTPGSTINVYVIAHNGGGDSAPSPTVAVVVV